LWYTAASESVDTATAAELTTIVNQQTSATDSDLSTVTNDVTTVTDSQTQTGMSETPALICRVEMCMGMGIPMGMGISWESHGNGTKIK